MTELLTQMVKTVDRIDRQATLALLGCAVALALVLIALVTL